MPSADHSPLTLNKVWAFFWPLALSGIIMYRGPTPSSRPALPACRTLS